MDQEEKPPPMGRNRSDSDDSHKIEFGARSSAQPKAKGDASGGSEQATANGLEEGESHPELLSDVHIPKSSFKMSVDTSPLAKWQRYLRNTFLPRLHCKNLSERLTFESNLKRGLFRLINQSLIFSLMVIALRLSGDPTVKRGIFNDLSTSFNLDVLQEASSRQDFLDALRDISRASKKYFILSSQYFAEAGHVELIGPLKSFSGPSLVNAEVAITVPSVSFTAWVKVTPQFVNGYLLRKRLTAAGDGSDLACWGWHLHRQTGQGLHFGVHDVFPTDRNRGRGAKGHVELQSAEKHETATNAYQLLTMVVNSSNVLFYNNLDFLGSAAMSRPLTDCFNHQEGILLGSAEMEIGHLRFYPRALRVSDIEEIYQFGSRLSDIVTGSQPITASEEQWTEISRSLSSLITKVGTQFDSQQDLRELTTAAQMREESKNSRLWAPRTTYSMPAFPASDTNAVSWDENAKAHVLSNDTVIQRGFYQILKDATRLTKTNEGPVDDSRHITHMPSFLGTGMTLTWWYRHVPCDGTCGIYLFHSGDFSGVDGAKQWCWTVWLEDEAIWFDAGGGGYSYFEKDMGMPLRFHITGDRFWRHMALQLDEVEDKLRFYLDGTLALEKTWDVKNHGKINAADCDTSVGPKRLSLGHSFGGYNHGRESEIADVRMYIHGTNAANAGASNNTALRGRLMDSEIAKVAVQAIPSSPLVKTYVGEDYRCLPITSPKLADSTWVDAHGHDCEWFFDNKGIKPEICHLDEPQMKCPKSCQARQECFAKEREVKYYFVWDRTGLIDMQSANGTVCLGKDMSKTSVVQECRAWIARNPNGGEGSFGGRGLDATGKHTGSMTHPDDDYLLGWLESMGVAGQGFSFAKSGVPQPRMGRRLNLTLCDELEAAIDEHCAFDLEPVRSFTQDLKANGGDWTIAFWVRADPNQPERSQLDGSGRFFPHISFYPSISPPQHALTVGKWVNPDGEFRLNTNCLQPGGRDAYWNVMHSQVSNTGWTFMAMTTSNSTDPLTMGTLTNLGFQSETEPLASAKHVNCLYDKEYLFKGIEINYPMLISPIMMVPAKMPLATLQEEYLRLAREMRIKVGPVMSDAKRSLNRVLVEKQDYTSRSILMASPILMQTRVSTAEGCPYQYSTKWMDTQHKKAIDDKCLMPFECDASVLMNKQSVMACPGDPAHESTYFGLAPLNFEGQLGYADFLYSVIDNEIVYRSNEVDGGGIMFTDSFIDSLTRQAKVAILLYEHIQNGAVMNAISGGQRVVLVFFTPSKGVVTVLKVSADFMGTETIMCSVSVDHYGILEGEGLLLYFIVQSIVLFNLVIMLVDVVAGFRNAVTKYSRTRRLGSQDILEPIIDLSCALLVLGYIVLKMPSMLYSADNAAAVLNSLDQIPWSSPDIPLSKKKSDFFTNVMLLIGMIDEDKFMNMLCNTILLVNLLRVIQCTSVHPRLAILTGTLANAADDLLHTAILTCILMMCFAGIGNWRFGNTRADFATLEITLRTQFEMLFGEFPQAWGEDPGLQRELQVFVVLYLLVLFLLVLNFLLAIIVEAYMQLRAKMDSRNTDQDFLTDVCHCVNASIRGWIHGWPSSRILGSVISVWECKNSVAYKDLYATRLFRDHVSIHKFILYYSGYAFLEPRPVGRYGFDPAYSNVWKNLTGQDQVADLSHLGQILTRKISLAGGNSILTLREELNQALLVVAERYRNAGKQESAKAVETVLGSCSQKPNPASNKSTSRCPMCNEVQGKGGKESKESKAKRPNKNTSSEQKKGSSKPSREVTTKTCAAEAVSTQPVEISSGTFSFWGLPPINYPEGLPEMPLMPAMPQMPEIPGMPQLPAIPAMSDVHLAVPGFAPFELGGGEKAGTMPDEKAVKGKESAE